MPLFSQWSLWIHFRPLWLNPFQNRQAWIASANDSSSKKVKANYQTPFLRFRRTFYEVLTHCETNRWDQYRRQSFLCHPSIPAWHCNLESRSPLQYWQASHGHHCPRFSPATGVYYLAVYKIEVLAKDVFYMPSNTYLIIWMNASNRRNSQIYRVIHQCLCGDRACFS